MTTLLTGFAPFGAHETNPSQLLVEALAGDGGVATAVLPVSYARAAGELARAVHAAEPDLVVCFGLAERRAEVSVERFALNLDDAESADNDGVVRAAAIDPDGPVAYRSGLPVDEVVAALREAGLPAGSSRDAGGYLCNHVFYALSRLLERERPQTRCGFVHVPPLEVLPLEQLVRAARIVVASAAGSASPAGAIVRA
ncbi:MAG TPA: pyroglutamyl-peptidase I [Gaiellaceae bacterium]|nr:pyroglutamyl-peptidase I [Gaiellaceae bacterium]